MNTIAHNISAMNAQRQFGINSRVKTKSIEKLSSGYRINRAADDAAGLAISEKMRGQIRGLSQGTRNVQNGISLLQVADGALSEVSEMLHRIKELSVQAANGTNTDIDREYLQDEVFLLLEAIDEISEDTEFNTQKVFWKQKKTVTNHYEDSGNTGSPGGTIIINKERTINVSISGTPTDTNAVQYSMSADITQGIIIDSSVYKWEDIKSGTGKSLIDSPIESGTYSFHHKGIKVDIDVSEGQTLENIVNNINGLSLNVSERIKNQTLAVSNIDMDTASMETVEHTTAISSPPEHHIHADENGLWIDSNRQVSWASMGIDIDNIASGTYHFKDPDSSIGFSFKIEVGATKNAVISGLNNVQIGASKYRYSHYFASASGGSNDGCSLKTYDALGPSGIMATNCTAGEYLGAMSGGNSRYSTYFVFVKDTRGNPCLSYRADSVDGTPNSKHNFYITDESLRALKNFDYTLPSSEQTFSQITGRKLEFRSENGSIIYMYLDNNGFGSYDEVLEDFDGKSFIAFSGGDVQMTYELSSASPNTIASGNVGTTTYETYIADADKELLEYTDTYTETIIIPPTPPSIPEKVEEEDTYEQQWWIQAGANEGQGMWLTIDNMSTSLLGIDDVDVSTVDGATNAIISVREALAKVTKNRSKIGAQQNRLEHTFDREEIAIENLSASESRIRDADMALEMTEYAKINILEQVSQSMMAQANQSEQRVLQLLSM